VKSGVSSPIWTQEGATANCVDRPIRSPRRFSAGSRSKGGHLVVDHRAPDGPRAHQLPSQSLPTISQCFSRVRVAVLTHSAMASFLAASRVERTAQPKPRVPDTRSHAIANEAPPQTDEACGGCGSGRRLMTSFW
jgi:hypothetical protein